MLLYVYSYGKEKESYVSLWALFTFDYSRIIILYKPLSFKLPSYRSVFFPIISKPFCGLVDLH